MASVNHPNVVVVHDSGVDDVPYLVTEYLAGGSLRGILDTGRLLTPSQALMVGLEAVPVWRISLALMSLTFSAVMCSSPLTGGITAGPTAAAAAPTW